MKNVDKIDQEVERTLRALEGITPVEPKPYFYTRLHARMEREFTTPRQVLGWQIRPVYLLSVLGIVLIMNVITFISFQERRTHANNISAKNTAEYYEFYNAEGN